MWKSGSPSYKVGLLGNEENKREYNNTKEEEEGISQNERGEEGGIKQQAATGASYWSFLKSNHQFDLVWSGSIVSQTGTFIKTNNKKIDLK